MRKLLFLPVLLSTVLSAAPAPAPNAAKASIRSGPMLGYADLTEASVWIQTTADTETRLRYWPEGKRADSRTTTALVADEKTDHTALFVIPGLEPGTRYGYEILIAGRPAAFPAGAASGTFDTQAFWQYRSNPPDFTVAFGSLA